MLQHVGSFSSHAIVAGSLLDSDIVVFQWISIDMEKR